MMSTCCSKHVEAWNKYIKKERVKLVINQKYRSLKIFLTLIKQIYIAVFKNLRSPWQRDRNSSSRDARATKFYTGAPNIFVFSVWNYIPPFLAPKILKWFLDLGKNFVEYGSMVRQIELEADRTENVVAMYSGLTEQVVTIRAGRWS
jgi:hypothetical protein